MLKTAIVREIKGTKILASFVGETSKDLPSCHCSSLQIFPRRQATFLVQNPKNLPLAPQTVVEIFSPPWQGLIDSFLILFLPLLCFVGLFVGTKPFLPEALRVLVSLGAGVGALLLVKLLKASVVCQRWLPKVVTLKERSATSSSKNCCDERSCSCLHR